MLVSPLPPSFLDTYSLSTLSLGWNALCMVISFLILWSICLSSSLSHFSKDPEYLPKGTVQVLIPLIRFLINSFVFSSFLVLLRYSFWILSFVSTCLMVSASNIIIIITKKKLKKSFTLFEFFYTSVSSWPFVRIWVTASLLNSPGLFSVFWPF